VPFVRLRLAELGAGQAANELPLRASRSHYGVGHARQVAWIAAVSLGETTVGYESSMGLASAGIRKRETCRGLDRTACAYHQKDTSSRRIGDRVQQVRG
jgi:hypothetical protein